MLLEITNTDDVHGLTDLVNATIQQVYTMTTTVTLITFGLLAVTVIRRLGDLITHALVLRLVRGVMR
jgi:hypothetical protein